MQWLGCLLGAKLFNSVESLLWQLHWLPICFQVLFKVLVLTFKAVHGLGPDYLRDCLLPYIPTHPFRSCEGAFLQVLPFSEVRRMAAQGQAFSVVAPQLWNSLLGEWRSTPSLMAFWQGLKTFLFRLTFGWWVVFLLWLCIGSLVVNTLPSSKWFYLFIVILFFYIVYLFGNCKLPYKWHLPWQKKAVVKIF